MIEADLVAHLRANTELTALVGNRIYGMVAPQNTVKPYITYQVITNNDISSFGGEVYENRVRFQIDIFSLSQSNCKEVLGVVKEALYTFKHYPHNLFYRDLFENETKLYRQLIDFKFTL